MVKVPVTDIKPIELARQLTIMFVKYFNEIPPMELLTKDRPNCSKMIQLCNKVKGVKGGGGGGGHSSAFLQVQEKEINGKIL